MKKKNYHHGDLKTACIKEGLRIIRETGFYDFSMRDIAKNLGVSHGAPYKHFETKEVLLSEIAEEGFYLLTKEVEKLVSESKEEDLELMYNIAFLYIKFGTEFPEYYKLMFGGVIKNAENYPNLYEASTKSYNTFKSLTESLIKSEKLIPTTNSNLMTFYSWSLLHGLVSLSQDNRMNIAFGAGNTENTTEIMNELFSYFLNGVLNKKI